LNEVKPFFHACFMIFFQVQAAFGDADLCGFRGQRVAVVEHQNTFGEAQCAQTVLRLASADVAFAVAPACTNRKVDAEHVAARAVPMVGGDGEDAFAVLGACGVGMEAAPVMANHDGNRVLVIVPPRIAHGEPPSPAGEKGFGGGFFNAAGERADGVVAAAVHVVRGGSGQHGGRVAVVFQRVCVLPLFVQILVVPRGVFDAALQFVVPFLIKIDNVALLLRTDFFDGIRPL